MKEINETNFKEEIKEGVTLVDFYATWCGPCKMLHPILEELSSTRGEVTFKQIDVDEAPNISKEFGVMSIPTLILFKDGEEIAKNIGFISKSELTDWINNQL